MKFLITFEGGEGAGKTTLITLLAEKFKEEGRCVLCTRAPGSLKIGTKIRQLLLDSSLKSEITPKTELFLFLADRASHVEKEILPALNNGTVVLCDRYNDSTIVYQGIAREIGREKVEMLCDFACSGLKPSLTFYLDIAPEVGLQRSSSVRKMDRIESEDLSFHEKIRIGYLQIAHEEPERVHILDASKDKKQVLEDAWQLIRLSHLTQR